MFAPPNAIRFDWLRKKILNPFDEKPMAQWAYTDSVFLILEHE